MVEFDRLQQLWQAQEPPPRPLDAASLSHAFGRYFARQGRINAVKLAAILAAVALGAWRIRGYPLALAGEALVLAGGVLFLLLDWRNQRALGRLDFTQASAGFVRSAAARLAEQREPFRRYLGYFAFFFGGGLNVMLWDILRQRAPVTRLLTHLLWSALLPVGYAVGRWVRILRFEKDCRPLVERLAALQDSLTERAR